MISLDIAQDDFRVHHVGIMSRVVIRGQMRRRQVLKLFCQAAALRDDPYLSWCDYLLFLKFVASAARSRKITCNLKDPPATAVVVWQLEGLVNSSGESGMIGYVCSRLWTHHVQEFADAVDTVNRGCTARISDSVGQSSDRQKIHFSTTGFVALVAIVCVLLGSPSSSRAEPMAENVVRQLITDLDSSFDLPPGAQRRARMISVLDANTNIELISRLALGRHWKRLDSSQKRVYQELFHDVILDTLAGRLETHTQDIEGPIGDRIEIKRSDAVGRKDQIVRSLVQPASGPPLAVDWRIRDGEIIDIVVESVSLLVSQRAEFGAVVDHSGVDGLIIELRKRTEVASVQDG